MGSESDTPNPAEPDVDDGMHPDAVVRHATCVAVNGQAVLIFGASGSGKSALALELMAFGADLVADDRTCLWPAGEQVLAAAPDSIKGKIEARFVGLLNAAAVGPVAVALVVDLDHNEAQRLPPHRICKILGYTLPLLQNCESRHFPAAIMQYLRAGRSD